MTKVVFFLLLISCGLPGCLASRQGDLQSELEDYRGKTVEQLQQYAPPMEKAYNANSGVHYVWRLAKTEQGPPMVYYFVWRVSPRNVGRKDLDYVRVESNSQEVVQSFEFVDELPE